MPGYNLAGSIQSQQIVGNFLDCLLGLAFDLLPFGCAEAIDPRFVVGHPHVAAQAVGLVHGHVQLVAGSVLDQEVLALATVQAHLDQTRKESDAVLDMHHVRAGLYVGEEGLGRHGTGATRPSRNRARPTKYLSISQQVEGSLCDGGVGITGTTQDPAFGQGALHQGQTARRRRFGNLDDRRGGYGSILKEFGDALSLTTDDDHPLSGIAHRLAAVQYALELPAIALTVGKEPSQGARLVFSGPAPEHQWLSGAQAFAQFLPAEVRFGKVPGEFTDLHQIGLQHPGLLVKVQHGSHERVPVIHQEKAVSRQVIEQGGWMGVEERQVEFDTAEIGALLQVDPVLLVFHPGRRVTGDDVQAVTALGCHRR